ncbi:MAG: tryptophan synthase alpha chain [Actinomycetota bacterium]|nr:tryptophan synthase alpha chain [Actinomycetota bacterium]
MSGLEDALRRRLSDGGRAFVPYVTGGFPGVDAPLLHRIEAAGADAIEVGIPFSDPVMDGDVIQEASRVALEKGTRPHDVLAMIGEAALSIPVAVMTYVNPVFRIGFEPFLDDAVANGVAGVIVPDLPVDESDQWTALADARGIAVVQLAAPGTSSERARRIAQGARGFVYCVATYGVTGARDALGDPARRVVAALRPLTGLPLLVGVGISTPEHAAEACTFADGVIVGTAMMAPIVAGDPDATVALATAFRDAIPTG